MALTIDQQIDSLGRTISESQWRLDVWETLRIAQSDATYVRVMNSYLEFFRSTILAHFESFIVSCYQILETRKDSINFNSLKISLLQQEKYDIDKDPELVKIQAQMKTIWIKICIVRNESIGHLTRGRPQDDVFTAAGLTATEFREFVELSKTLHKRITRERNRTVESFNIRGTDSTNELLAKLAKKI